MVATCYIARKNKGFANKPWKQAFHVIWWKHLGMILESPYGHHMANKCCPFCCNALARFYRQRQTLNTAIPMYAKLTQNLWKDALLQKSYNHVINHIWVNIRPKHHNSIENSLKGAQALWGLLTHVYGAIFHPQTSHLWIKCLMIQKLGISHAFI
jgi:hypothetical protein